MPVEYLDPASGEVLAKRTLRLASDDSERLPTCRFLADDVPVELVVFAERARRRVPLSPVDGRPMERAGLQAVEALAGGLV